MKSILFLSLLLFSFASVAETARIAVAANFTKTIEVLGEVFEQQSGHQLKFSFGPTGKLYAQIRHGAPFDAFFSADEKRPLLLVEQGGGVKNSYFVYAQGQIALFSYRLPVGEKPLQVLNQMNFNHLALANPKTAPYGASAKAFLSQQKLYKKLAPKIVRGESVGNAFQYVATRNAEIGFVAYSQLVDSQSPLYQQGSFWLVPASEYPPIKQGAVILKRGAHNQAVADFFTFLKTEQAHQILHEYGYLAGAQQ